MKIFRKKNEWGLLITLILVLTHFTGCTKKREATFPEGEKDQIFSVESLQNREFTARLSTQEVLPLSHSIEASQIVLAGVSDSDAPAELLPMLRELKIPGVPGQVVKIRLKLDPFYLTGYQVVPESEIKTLTPSQLDLLEQDGTVRLVPLFQYKVERYGVREEQTNKRGEKTDNLWLRPTDYAFARDLKVSTLTRDRLLVELPSDLKDEVFSLSTFQNQKFVVRLGKEGYRNSRSQNSLALNKNQGDRYEAEPIQSLPEEMEGLFRELYLRGVSGQEYEIRFIAYKKYLTAYKLVQDLSELDPIEKGLADETKRDLARLGVSVPEVGVLVPIFQYPISLSGKIRRSLDSNGYLTSTLELTETDWERATHLQVSLTSQNRKEIALNKSVLESETSQIFSRKDLDGRLYSKSEFIEKFNLQMDYSGLKDVYLEVKSGRLYVYEVLNFTDLTDLEKQSILNQDQNLGVVNPVKRCSEVSLKELPEGITKRDCVLGLRKKLDISYVSVERSRENDNRSNEVRFSESTEDLAHLIEISSHSSVEEVSTATSYLDPGKSLVTSSMRGFEFFFRRTMQDSPNGFDYTFTGSSGDLEIVKFLFEEDRVRVVRSKPLLEHEGSNGGNTEVDLETLLSVPAHYVRKELTDSKGRRIGVPRYVKTTHDDPAAIALIDWTRNEVPNVSSPLNYYALEQCFTRASARTVSGVDQRIESDGMLNFTLATTYTANADVGCVGIYSAGGFDRVQANYTFKERLSFKKYLSQDEKPLLNVPYLAQKKLGFGLFTYSKNSPNRYGNTGVEGTKPPLPSLFDIRKGRKITYILAGIPEKGKLRDAVIKATREVIADWNEAFRKALKGTDLERSGDVLELKVEGLDAPPVTVGDLDQNLIYYVQKPTRSKVIGLGGAHANPRSGHVEAASVFMYGGNILSSVEFMKKRERAKLNYERQLQIIPPSKKGSGNPPDNFGGFLQPGVGTIVSPPRQIISGVQEKASILFEEAPFLGLKQRVSPSENLEDFGLLASGIRKEDLALLHAFQEMKQTGAWDSSEKLEAVFGREWVEAHQGKMTANEYSRLSAFYQNKKTTAELFERLAEHNICVRTSAHFSSTQTSILKMDDLDVVAAVYKPTLAHEIGHNLGLRHNFIASYDKENWKFSAADVSKRDHSSVMDYLTTDHETYDGLAPYDVMALRASYAGLLELDPSFVSKVRPTANGKAALLGPSGESVEVLDGHFVRIEDVRRATVGTDGTWLDYVDLGPSGRDEFKLKKYRYCSDEDAGTYPTCNRHDRGATPLEIVKAIEEDYYAYYSLRNFPNDRLNFDWDEMGGYLGGLFQSFIPARQFLEETILQATEGGEGVNELASAAIEALQFFHGIIRIPDAPSDLAGTNARYLPVPLPKNQGTLLVERKGLKNDSVDLDSTRLKVRGIEYDKAIALMMLTQRGFGFPRYERRLLRFSFPELERLVISTAAQDPLSLPTIGLLKEALEDRIRPQALLANGQAVGLGPQFQSSVNQLVRTYAIIGAMVNLDVDGFEESDNNSALFRVMSGFTAPQGKTSLMKRGARGGSDTLRYWAVDGAEVARLMVDRLDLLGKANALKKGLGEKIQKWAVLKLTPPASGAPTGAVPCDPDTDLACLEAAINQEIAALPAGMTEIKGMSELGSLLSQVLQVGMQLELQKSQLNSKQLRSQVSGLQTQLGNLSKEDLLVGLALSSLDGKALKIDTLDEILPKSILASSESLGFRTLETLNQLFFQTHGEFNRDVK